MNDFSNWAGSDLLPLNAAEVRLLSGCALAIGDADRRASASETVEDDAELAQSLRAADGQWRLILHQWAQQPEIRRGLVAFLASTVTPEPDDDEPASPRQALRREGLLDIIGVPFCASDVIGQLLSNGQQMAEASTSGSTKHLVSAGKLVATGLAAHAGLFGIRPALNRLGERLVSGEHVWDDLVDRWAHLTVVSCALYDTDEDGASLGIRTALANDMVAASIAMRTTQASLSSLDAATRDGRLERLSARLRGEERILRVLSCAASLLPALETTERVSLPDVRGAVLPDAQLALQPLLLQGEGKDASGSRSIINPANWTVWEQKPNPGELVSPGSRIALRCTKATDEGVQSARGSGRDELDP